MGNFNFTGRKGEFTRSKLRSMIVVIRFDALSNKVNVFLMLLRGYKLSNIYIRPQFLYFR